MTNGIHRIRYLFLIYSDKISPGTAKYIPHINTETSFFTAYMSNRFFLAKTMQIIKKKKYEITIINPDITRSEKYLPKIYLFFPVLKIKNRSVFWLIRQGKFTIIDANIQR
ncbi:hypothetical protein [Eshraghiella crossota]|uniref:hypothetical protein n=1 Tax=Eshraghiella crossota TaxID=45851 RepID=UPI003AB735DB